MMRIFCRAVPGLSLAVTAMLGSGCMTNYRSFSEWYWDSGFRNYGHYSMDTIARDSRSRIYAHFRLPELIWQPAGGFQVPALDFDGGNFHWGVGGSGGGGHKGFPTGVSGSVIPIPGSSHRLTTRKGKWADSLGFFWANGGLLDVVPYRYWAVPDVSLRRKILTTPLYPVAFLFGYSASLLYRPLYYAGHDAYKTVTIPAALVYYSVPERFRRNFRNNSE